MLGITHLTTTIYYLQTNSQPELFNKTLVERLYHYLAEHQNEWHEYFQPLTYAYNVQVHRRPGTTPLDLELSRRLPGSQEEKSPIAILDDEPENTSTTQVKRCILIRLRDALSSAQTRSTHAQRHYKRDFDNSLRPFFKLNPGDEVYGDRTE